jgi:RNA polymerase sigma-70 factor, ECF subfamily
MTDSSHEVTVLLQEWSGGDRAALEKLLPLVYDELRKLARSYLYRERSDHTLQTTALVHEAYLKLVDQKRVTWQNRGHFFAIAAQAMRRILVDQARKHSAAKRGSGGEKLELDEGLAISAAPDEDLLALESALQELEQLDPQQGRVVELRYFGGLTIEETAEVMELSPATVKREWAMARAWLYRAVTGRAEGSGS